jgi:hypothetical protein
MLLDNASEDGSVALFRNLLPEGVVVQMPDNRSPGNARNAGIERTRTDLVLFMDNDIELCTGTVELLSRALISVPEAVAAAPRVVYADNPTMIQYEGADCHFLAHMVLRSEDAPVGSTPPQTVRTQSLVSACFLLDRSRWPEARFDPAFEFYYEDHDFGLRARLAGHQLLAVGEALTLHGPGTPALSLRPGGNYAPRRVKTMISGRWQTIIKIFSGRTILVLAPVLLVYELAQLGGVLKKGWWPEWLAAARTLRAQFSSLLASRRVIQSSRRVPDRCLLRGGPIPFKKELGDSRVERGALKLVNLLANGYWWMAKRLI